MQNGGTGTKTLSRSRAGRIAVLAYLETPEGVKTPTDIGWLLVHLDWETLGCRGAPSFQQIHLTRGMLEDLAYWEACDEATEQLGGFPEHYEESTGVFGRGLGGSLRRIGS